MSKENELVETNTQGTESKEQIIKENDKATSTKLSQSEKKKAFFQLQTIRKKRRVESFVASLRNVDTLNPTASKCVSKMDFILENSYQIDKVHICLVPNELTEVYAFLNKIQKKKMELSASPLYFQKLDKFRKLEQDLQEFIKKNKNFLA